MTKINYPSKERLEELFVFEPSSGKLFRKQRSGKLKEVTTMSSKYLQVCIDYQTYQVHNLIYIMLYGALPNSGEVDHIDTDTLNNRPSNLREATKAQNRANRKMPSNNTSGYKGVSKRGNKWRVQISLEGKTHHKSGFDTAEAANEYAVAMRKLLHGEFARHE